MVSSKPISVVLVDQYVLFRKGVSMILEDNLDIEVAGEASNGLDAITLCELLHPDVILMELDLPEMNGLDVAQYLHQKNPGIKILILTGYVDENMVREAMAAGVSGYLSKHVTPQELLSAIRAAYRGDSVLSPAVMKALIRSTHHTEKTQFTLTEREQEVLELLTRGLTNSEIAEHLSISYYTAKKHVSRILAKMNTENRTEAVALALQHNIARSN